MERIAVIGAGLMGHGIAQVFAAAGHEVAVTDTDAARLASVGERIGGNLARMVAHGVGPADPPSTILKRIRTLPDLAAACAGAHVVVEAAYEDMALKQRLFAELDAACPPWTVLCSNTSTFRITEVAARATHRERILGTHFWLPPYLVPLVEVVRTAQTAPESVDVVIGLLQRAGKHPVRVQKDVAGFVGNRLQHALWREAFAIIDEGICDPGTVDEVIRNGFGLRLAVLGPVENADVIGLDLTLAIHNYLLRHLNADAAPSRTLRAKVARGELGLKSGGGFLPWSEAAIAESRDRVTAHLMRALRPVRGGGNPQRPDW